MKTEYVILTINPGSTSTKVAIYHNDRCIFSKNLFHQPEELAQAQSLTDQRSFRKNTILDFLKEQSITVENLDAIAARGGLLRPLKGGTYRIGPLMLEELGAQRNGVHASNLGALIAHEIIGDRQIPSFIVNPVTVDEMEPVARISGMEGILRKSAFHALNQKAVAMGYAKSLGRKYEELNMIVTHLGGGISVGAHRKGRVIDVNNALEEGPFSPERAGGVPVQQLIAMCYSGDYQQRDISKMLVGKGGIISYLGTADCLEVERRIAEGDTKARLVYEAMAYQTAKEIGAAATVLKGKIDQILITGGIARSRLLVEMIRERVEFLAPITVHPGEDELQALAEGVLRVLTGEEEAMDYEASVSGVSK